VITAKVVDASVIAAIAFEEPSPDAAEALVDGFMLCAPDVLQFELTNVAWKKGRLRPGDAERLRAALATALDFGVRLLPVLHTEVLDLALATGTTAYDASYLWLARDLGAPIASLDHRMKEAAATLDL
jgi:predicted nucleic acid-binding protein